MITRYFEIEETGKYRHGTSYVELNMNKITAKRLTPEKLFRRRGIQVREITRKEYDESHLVIGLDDGDIHHP
jgi:N-dimethylarginine dimethylaminohydrolase